MCVWVSLFVCSCEFVWTFFFHSFFISILYLSFCLCASEPGHAFESSCNMVELFVLFYTCHMVWYSMISRIVMSHSSAHLHPSAHSLHLPLNFPDVREPVPECFTLEVSKSSVSVSIIRSGDEAMEQAEPCRAQMVRFDAI